jgi:TonB family protein
LPAFAAGQATPLPAGSVVVQQPPARGAKPAVKPQPVPKPPSPTAAALSAAGKEILAGHKPGAYAAWMATLPGFRFSPATSKLLVKQLGTDKLFTVKRQEITGGGQDYQFTAPALRHTDPDGSSFAWDTVLGSVKIAPDRITIANQFNAPRFSVEDKTMRVDVRDVAVSGTSLDKGIGYGDGQVDVANVQMLSKADGSTMSMDGLFGKFGLKDEGPSVSMYYETGVRTVAFQGERIDDLHLAMHFTGLDKAALDELGKMGQDMKAQEARLAKLPPEAMTAAIQEQLFKQMMRQMGVAVTAKGASIALDDISFSYRGNKASLRGQMHLENVTPADLDQPAAMGKKVVAHFDVQVPLAMLRAFSDAMVRKQLAKTQPGADAATIEKAGLQGYETALRQAVASGYAKVEGDMLVTSVDIRDGNVLINGKPFEMPKRAAPVAAVDSAAGVMRARRIAEKCTLPDFPPDVVAQDSALSMMLRLTVNADGSVSNVALAGSSGFPDYDKAVLAAATRCTYIPALKNGKPVALPTTWQIVRTPGTARP